MEHRVSPAFTRTCLYHPDASDVCVSHSIDLRAASFAPGHALYDRVQFCLGADRIPPLTWLMTWQNAGARRSVLVTCGVGSDFFVLCCVVAALAEGLCSAIQFPAGVLHVHQFPTTRCAPHAFAGASHALRALPAVDTLHDAVSALEAAAREQRQAKGAGAGAGPAHRVRPIGGGGAVHAAPPAPTHSEAEASAELHHELLEWLGAMACRTAKLLQLQTDLSNPPPHPIATASKPAPATATATTTTTTTTDSSASSASSSAPAPLPAPAPAPAPSLADWEAAAPVSALSTKPSLSLKAQIQALRARAAAPAASKLSAKPTDFMSLDESHAPTKAVDTKTPASAASGGSGSGIGVGAHPPASESPLESYVSGFAFHALPFRPTPALAQLSTPLSALSAVPVAYRWRGLLLPADVQRALTHARALVHSGRAAWCALMVWGFADTNVSWLTTHHASASKPSAAPAPAPVPAAATTAATAASASNAAVEHKHDNHSASAASGKPRRNRKKKGTARQRQQRPHPSMPAATEHTYSGEGCGENNYVLVVLPDDRFWLYVMSAGLDSFS
jgi:hypothetical protein